MLWYVHWQAGKGYIMGFIMVRTRLLRNTTSVATIRNGAPSPSGPSPLSLLGLMAKIKCSICSYQFNIWYATTVAHILIWFLAFGQGNEVYLTLTTGCLGVALQSSAAHPLINIQMKRENRYFLPAVGLGLRYIYYIYISYTRYILYTIGLLRSI